MISGHAAAAHHSLPAGLGLEGNSAFPGLDVERLECPHARRIADSQATTVPFGLVGERAEPVGPGDREGAETDSLEVDEEGGVRVPARTAADLSTGPSTPVPEPVRGVHDVLHEIKSEIEANSVNSENLEGEPPVPREPKNEDACRIPPRRKSTEELIPGPATLDFPSAGHHASALERLLVRKSAGESSGSESSRKPPPPELPRLEPPGFGGERSAKDRRGAAEYYDLDPPDELRTAQSLPAPSNPVRARRDRVAPYEADTPPWVGALEGRILAHLEPLKQDVSDISARHTEMHRELAQIASDFRAQEIRVDTHDAVIREHTTLHENTGHRLTALEREVRELRAASRSPTPNRNPRSPGDGRLTPTRERDVEEELQLVIGGWEDCKKDEAVEEAKAIFEAVQLPNVWQEIWSSYSRTSHARVILSFPEHCKKLPQQRAFQTEVLEKLKKRKWSSSIPGNEGRTIWIQRHRNPEDRAKIRAIVSVKEFIDQLTFGNGLRKRHAEIDWRGKLFVDNTNILGHPQQVDLKEHDLPLTDSRGNHSGWFIQAEKFSRATGHPPEALESLWQSRTTSRP